MISESLIKNQALSQQIYALLKNEILHHKLLPGERIIDVQVATRFGVSRTPAREAIFQLMRGGLLEKRENGGFYVMLPDHRDIDEIYEIRKMIEQEAVRKVIGTLKRGDQQMEQRVAAWKDRYFNGLQGQRPFSEVDSEMHLGLIALTDNQHLVKLYQECCNQMELFRQNTDEYENRIEKAKAVHKDLIDGVYTRNLALAEETISDHLALAVAEAHELLDEQ